MTKQNNLFLATLNALHKSGALKDVILIGSWCHYFYRIQFKNAPEIPVVRTMDIDFLIPNPPKKLKDINIPDLLYDLDFIPKHNYITGNTKYVHPELELEFLIPELGRGKGSKPYEIPKLHINAVGLRFLNLLQSNTMKIKYKNIEVIVPEPAAFVLHKFIIQERRKNKEKQKKDLFAAVSIGEYLLQRKEQQTKMKVIFNSLPKKWQSNILRNVEANSTSIFDYLSE